MQTSAPQVATVDAEAEYTGVITHRPEVRTKMLDAEGHEVPVLVIDVECDAPTRPLMRLEQTFARDQRPLAEQLARDYAKGTRIQYRAPLVGMRVIAPNVTRITALHNNNVTTTEPDLFTP